MISPMMVMTTSISTSVKPRLARGAPSCDDFAKAASCWTAPYADDLADRQQRRHHRHDQAADDDADDDDRQPVRRCRRRGRGCAAAWPRRIRRRGRPASATDRFPRRAAACAPPSPAAPRFRRARPKACRRGGRGRRHRSRPRRDRSVAIMSTRMRSVVGQGDAAAEQDAEIAAEQRGAVIASSPARISGSRARPLDDAGAARSAGAAAASAADDRTAARPRALRRYARAGKSKARRSAATIGSSLASKSRSTLANCGSTNSQEEQQHAAGGAQHEQPDSAARRRACGAAPRRGCARRPAPRAPGRACPRLRRPAPARHTSAETAPGGAPAPRRSFRRRGRATRIFGDDRPQAGRNRCRRRAVRAPSLMRAPALQQQREVAGENGDVLGLAAC